MNKRSFFFVLRLALGLVLLSGLILGDITPANASGLCYVKADASGQNDGSSWPNAYTSLQSALGASPCTEVWVAAGTYLPTQGTDRTISFVLKNGVSLYGGFAGTETQLSERDPNANPTYLSGDIGLPSVTSDNSQHVVVGSSTNSTAVLDGFTILFGFGDSGGGMYNDGGSPSLTNVQFYGNSAAMGGGMFNVNGSSPILTNVVFDTNSARSQGGGMCNLSGSNPVLSEVYFQYNLAGLDGAGMFNEASSPSLTNVYFYSNKGGSFGWGGGMHNRGSSAPSLTHVQFHGNSAAMGGGMFNSGNSNPTLTDVTFTQNQAVASENATGGKGGGIFNENASSPSLVDVTFTENSAGVDGGGMYNDMSSPSLVNVSFSNNLAGTTEERGSGGGMYNWRSSHPSLENVTFLENYGFGGGGMYNSDSSSPILNNVTFRLNWAEVGGAMRNTVDSSPSLVNVIFDRNQANFGAGMHNTSGSNPSLMNVTFNGGTGESGGGMLNSQSSPTLVNVTFTNNGVSGGFGTGGAMVNGDGSNPSLTNVTISGNYSDDEGGGGGIANYASNPIITNSIIYGNTEGEIVNFDSSNPSVSFSIVQGGYPGTGNLDADPLLGPLQDNGGFTQTMALGPGSPAIDAADDSVCPATDQRGVPRPQGAGCDMGAFEVEQVLPPGQLSIRSNGEYDGWILESGENTRIGGSKNSVGTLLRLGDSPTNRQYSAILSFDTSILPDNAIITSIVLKIKKKGVAGTDPFTTHGHLKVDVRQGSFSDDPALQLTDFQAAVSQAEVAHFDKFPVDGWYSATLPEPAFGWINLGGETQFRLRFGRDDDNDLVADVVRFYSGNAETPEDRPELIVEYMVP